MEHYKHKYLCLFPNQEEYDKISEEFTECNYSIINPPEEIPDSYYPSTRETNNDDKYVMKYNFTDNLIKKFFLEIIWGYFGFEWNDYEYNNEVLKGGNLYKIKEIETVRSINDGLRLYHINDFLNSQNKVNLINIFDASNIIAANRAFMRLENTKLFRSSSNPYYFNYTPIKLTLNVLDWPSLEEADFFFAGNQVQLGDDGLGILKIPKITSLKGFLIGGSECTCPINAPNLSSFDYGFQMTNWNSFYIDLNNFFVDENGSSLFPSGLKSIKYLMYMAHLLNNYNDESSIHLDLTGLKLEDDDIIDASNSFAWIRNQYNTSNKGLPQYKLNIDLDFNHNINLSGAFKGICDINSSGYVTYRLVTYTNTNGIEESYTYLSNPFSEVDFKNIFDSEHLPYITDISEGLSCNKFETNPLQQLPNDNCNDNGVYKNCIISNLVYDFSPNKVLISNDNYGQFNGVAGIDTIDFKNVEYLKDIQFTNITLNTPCEFPCKIQNTELSYSDITDYTNYRTILSFENSDFTKIQDTNLYYYIIFTSAWIKVNPFYGCEYIDFKDTLNIYYGFSPYEFSNGGTVTWDFQKNTSMTVAPIIHHKYVIEYPHWRVFFRFDNLKNLTTVDLSNFTITDSYEWDNISLYFTDCTNLKYVYLKDFYKGIDFTGCYNLDIDTFQQQIQNAIQNKSSSNFLALYLTLQEGIWNQCSEEFQEFCIKYYTINIVNDEEQESSEN